MKVTIWDMDFYNKKSFLPNPLLMKISSFHKQQGDLVNFVEDEHQIYMSYDIYYLVREKDSTPKPPGRLLDDKKVRLIGRGMRFLGETWSPPEIVSAVRPDYQLYPEKERDAYYNANVVQFFHNGKRLALKQPFENVTKFHKKTLVVDKDFWSASYEDIILCLQELENYKNVAFLHPIDLKKILKNSIVSDLFSKLKYSPGTIFRFRNNYGQEYDDAIVIFELIQKMKESNNGVRFSNIPFKAVTADHWEDRELAMRDLERCLRIADAAKESKIHIRIISPDNRFESPYWYYFETLEHWTVYLERLSYIEMMTYSAEKKTGLVWFQVLNSNLKWVTPNIYFLLSLFTKSDLVEKYGYRQWGDDFVDKKMIDFNEIEKFKGIKYDPAKKIEEE